MQLKVLKCVRQWLIHKSSLPFVANKPR